MIDMCLVAVQELFQPFITCTCTQHESNVIDMYILIYYAIRKIPPFMLTFNTVLSTAENKSGFSIRAMITFRVIPRNIIVGNNVRSI